MMLNSLEMLHNAVLKIYETIEKEDLSITDAVYALQAVQIELIEQGYSPQFRELKEKRRKIIDARWEEHLARRAARISLDKATSPPCEETPIDCP